MIGIDIVKIDRIKKAAEGGSFLRAFTKNEIEYINTKKNPHQTMAGIFAAKEAAVKALGRGFCDIRPNSVEIFHDESGKPYAIAGNVKLEISISHDGDYAVATALYLSEEVE